MTSVVWQGLAQNDSGSKRTRFTLAMMTALIALVAASTLMSQDAESGTVTKAALAERIAEDSGITRKQADAALDSMLRTITETLGRGGRVDLADFGTFSVAERSARTGRNPATGEVIEIPAKRYTRFRAGKALMEAVDRGSS